MKDLLLYVADADALAFMNSLLKKPSALGIRPISFTIERHPRRDPGMVQSGAELARLKKKEFQKAILMWDHHGSGRDMFPAGKVQSDIQNKLDSFTWSGNSLVTILVPELEQWLWYCEKAILSHCEVTEDQLEHWLSAWATKQAKPIEVLKGEQPKEMFEFVMRDCLRRTISPRDFEKIGELASIKGLMGCESFRLVVETLKGWFPK